MLIRVRTATTASLPRNPRHGGGSPRAGPGRKSQAWAHLRTRTVVWRRHCLYSRSQRQPIDRNRQRYFTIHAEYAGIAELVTKAGSIPRGDRSGCGACWRSVHCNHTRRASAYMGGRSRHRRSGVLGRELTMVQRAAVRSPARLRGSSARA